MTDILLPNQWLYIYMRKVSLKNSKQGWLYCNTPQGNLYIENHERFIYVLKLMATPNNNQKKYDILNNNKKNLDIYNFIIMRKNIRPIWEDDKNKNGGTFSVKVPHLIGYDLWALFLKYMGESLTSEMEFINGMTVTYVTDNNSLTNSGGHTFIKIGMEKQAEPWNNSRRYCQIKFLKKLKILQ